MLKGVAKRQTQGRQTESEGAPSARAPDFISDPLRAPTTDPIQAESMRADVITDPFADRSDVLGQNPRVELDQLRDAMDDLDIDAQLSTLEEDEIEDIVIAAELDIEPAEVDEHEEILDDLLAVSSLSEQDLDLEDVAEEDLAPEEITDLLEIDELGTLMNELAGSEALDESSSVVEALVEEELDAAVDANTNGFANVFVTPEDMIVNEQRSQRRPMDDADTRMQVTPMSWVPNIIKVPVGRIAMDTRPLDRALNHHIKQDVSTLDEDNDIGVRTRRRFTPGIPDRKTVAANMAESHNQAGLQSTLTVVQAYHEVMQSTPDMAKTYLLGQIRMLGDWVGSEEARTDLKEGTTPLDWARETLLPSIVNDMRELENYFDMDHDMYFYRQWKSEALRVMREMDRKLELQSDLRREQDDDQGLTDMLNGIPAGGLVEWSMDNPEQAEELLEDREHRERFTERLIEELLSDAAVSGFLEQLDALLSPDGEEDEVLEEIRDALLSMDISRLTAMSVLPEMGEYHSTIMASITAITSLNPRFHGLLQGLIGRYGTEGSSLAAAIRDNPMPMVHTVVHGGRSVAPPTAVSREQDEGAPISSDAPLEEEDVEEDEGGGENDDDDDDDGENQ